jgi:hypothetical protein
MLNRNYWSTSDPSAWYFLDSLAIFAGKSYIYVDHPGTPVHIIGSFLLALTYPFFESREAFIRYYIAQPETFFILSNFFLLVANLLTVAVFYKTVTSSLKQDRVLAGVAVSLMYFAIHRSSFNSLIYWSHNSFNFIFGTLWLLWLYNEIQAEKALEYKRIILLGIAAGALVTTQLYLLPWLAGGIVTLFVYTLRRGQSLRQAIINMLIMFSSNLIGLAVMLAPIYRELPRLQAWLGGIIGRAGVYGTGEASIYTPELIPMALALWWQNTPLVIAALVIVLISFGWIAWQIKFKAPVSVSAEDFALAAGLLFQTFILVLVLSKMFYRIRFVLALAALLPVLFLIALKLLEQINWRNTGIKRAIYMGLIVSTLFFLFKESREQQRLAFVEQDSAAAYSRVIARLAKTKGVPQEEIVTVYAISTPFKCAGLLLANNWIRAFDRELHEQCHNQYAIYDSPNKFEPNTPYPIPSIEEIDWDLVVWPGTSSNLPAYLESVGGQTIPRKWHIRRDKWFFIRSEVLQE